MVLYDLVETFNLFGESLIKDDKGDLGYLTYRNRTRHKYHGRVAPHHPSPFHHWQPGTAIVLASYFLAPLALALDIQEEL